MNDTEADTPRTRRPRSGGAQRLWHALRHSLQGLRSACVQEAAFRQELAVGVPLVLIAPWVAPGRWQLLALWASVVLVWMTELLNSAIEALADRVSQDDNPLIGQAKDMGSAAVMLSLLLAACTWLVVLWH